MSTREPDEGAASYIVSKHATIVTNLVSSLRPACPSEMGFKQSVRSLNSIAAITLTFDS